MNREIARPKVAFDGNGSEDIGVHSEKKMRYLLILGLLFLAGCGLEGPNGPGEPVPPGGEDWLRSETARLREAEEACSTWIHPGTICPDDFGRPETAGTQLDSSDIGKG